MPKMNKWLSLLWLLFTPLLLSTACVRGEDEHDESPEANLRALWTTIDQKYCFLDYKEQALGMNWGAVYGKYAARLNPGMTQAQLFEVLCEMLAELQDGHVNLYSSADIGRYWAWHEDFPPNFDENLQSLYLGTDYRIASGLKYKVLDDNVGYVYCGSFENTIGDGNLDEVMHYLRTCNGLIVDVRDNAGGQLTMAEKLAARFTNAPLLVGYFAHKVGPGHNDFSTPRPQYLIPSSGIRWQKPVVVLTGRKCYSATNAFVRNMRECPRVTVVGDRTGGGSGMPFCSELPNGWLVRFSACPMWDARMQQIEFGIEPDEAVALRPEDAARGEDTLIEYARALLRS